MTEKPETTEVESPQSNQDNEAQKGTERDKPAGTGMTVAQLENLGKKLRKLPGYWMTGGPRSEDDIHELERMLKRFGDGRRRIKHSLTTKAEGKE